MITNERTYAVLVCGYNEKPNLERCLGGLLETVEEPEDLIFIDDASIDDSFEWVREHYPKITAIKNERNQHYTGVYNKGIRIAIERGKDYVLMVNADTEVVNEQFVEQLIEAAEKLPNSGFLGPKVYYREKGIIQNTSLLKPTLSRHLFGWFWWRIKPISYNRSDGKEHRAEFINTVCCLIRIHTIKDVGFMDESMGIYYDDVEWMARAEEKGWFSYYVPVESIIHHEKPSGYENYSLKTFMLKRNAVYYMLLRRGWAEAAIYAWFAVILAIIRCIFAPLKHEPIDRHLFFLKRLVNVYWNLLRRKAMGPWFGPPLTAWNGFNC